MKKVLFLICILLVNPVMTLAQGHGRRQQQEPRYEAPRERVFNETTEWLKDITNGYGRRAPTPEDYARESGFYNYTQPSPYPAYEERAYYPMSPSGNGVRVYGRVGSIGGSVEVQRQPRRTEPNIQPRDQYESKVIINNLTLYDEVPVTLRVEYLDPQGNHQTMRIDPITKLKWIDIKPRSEPIMFGEYDSDSPFEAVVRPKIHGNGNIIGWSAERPSTTIGGRQ